MFVWPINSIRGEFDDSVGLNKTPFQYKSNAGAVWDLSNHFYRIIVE